MRMPENNYTIKNKQDGTEIFVSRAEAWEQTQGSLLTANNAGEKREMMKDYLNGIRGELDHDRMELEKLGNYSESYKDVYTSDERKKQASKKGTMLWQKMKNAEAIEKEEGKRQKKMTERALEAIKRTGIRSKVTNPAVVALSAFMTGSGRKNAALLDSYRKKERREVLTACIKDFMSVDLDSLDVRSDKKAAENAEVLEKLSERFSGIQYLVTSSPDEYSALPDKLRVSFEKYYGKANTVVTHYRLKKQVMCDSYYRTHENREIGSKPDPKASAEQRNLTEMIWQSTGGLALFLNKSNEYILNGTLNSLKKALRSDGVSKERLSLQERMRKRRLELEKKGIVSRMDDLVRRERNVDVSGNLGIAGHARNLRSCAFSGDPDKDTALLPELMDQLEVITKTADLRKNSRSSYYMEQSDNQIAMSDTAINMQSCVERLQEDLLTIARLNKGGGIDTAVTQERMNICRERYRQDLEKYRLYMDGLKEVRNTAYELPKDSSPDTAQINEPEKNADTLQKEAKELITSLTEAGFGDWEIYRQRDRICALSKKCEGTEVSPVLNVLAKRAVVVWERKRLVNVKAALKKDKDNAALKSEAERLEQNEKLRTVHRNEEGKTVEGRDESFDDILKLRAEAEKKILDFNDLKAAAAHYTDQYDWALNSRQSSDGFLITVAGLYFDHIAKKYGSHRDIVHGEENYDEAVERMNRMPKEITSHQQGQSITLQRGDEDVPPVEITKYYEDTLKDEMKERADQIRSLYAGHENDYPPETGQALEALFNYVKVKYIVTADTTEMEAAFLDKFRKDVDRAFVKLHNVNFDDPVVKGMLDIMSDIDTFRRGRLRDKDNPNRISDAEYTAAMEQVPIYTMYDENDMKDINAKDMPLFLHRPNINDVKQGYVGDCYFMSAITAFIRSNPDGITEMFHDAGDGTVLVRLYMGFDENNRRVDDTADLEKDTTKIRPVYIRVRKDYDTKGSAHDCMWVQLLEKAYASTGTQHKTFKVNDRSGQLTGMARAISAGGVQKAMIHLTGRKDCWENDKPEKEKYNFDNELIEPQRMRILLAGVPMWLHDTIWSAISKDALNNSANEDEWVDAALEVVKEKAVEANEVRNEQIEQIKSDVLRDVKDIKSDELEAITNRIRELYILDPEAIAEMVRKNIFSEDPPEDDGMDLIDPSAVISSVYESLEQGAAPKDVLAAIGGKYQYYEPLRQIEGETDEQYKLRADYIRLYAKNRNKAMMEINPDGRYTKEEMIFLHDMRAGRERKEGMHFGVFGHAMDVLDVKLNNNRWFVLVRDTNNTRNMHYEKTEKGELKNTARKPSFVEKDGIRRLDGTLLNGIRGTSWWELKDIFDKMMSYGNAPKLRNAL